MSAETVAKKLDKARRSGNGWVACCPAHDDKNASLSLTDGADGKFSPNATQAAHSGRSRRHC